MYQLYSIDNTLIERPFGRKYRTLEGAYNALRREGAARKMKLRNDGTQSLCPYYMTNEDLSLTVRPV